MRGWVVFISLILNPLSFAIGSDLELQKDLYRQERWDEFFGRAIYLRAQVSTDQISSNENDHLLALELLALARHCQWEPISQLDKHYLMVTSDKNSLMKSKRAMGVIQVKEEYKKYLSDPKRESRPFVESIKTRRDHWPLSLQQFMTISDPQLLRVKVVSLCD